jgi:hypothetical protein
LAQHPAAAAIVAVADVSVDIAAADAVLDMDGSAADGVPVDDTLLAAADGNDGPVVDAVGTVVGGDAASNVQDRCWCRSCCLVIMDLLDEPSTRNVPKLEERPKSGASQHLKRSPSSVQGFVRCGLWTAEVRSFVPRRASPCAGVGVPGKLPRLPHHLSYSECW